MVPLDLFFLQVSGGGMWLLWLGLSNESKVLLPPLVLVPWSCLLAAALGDFYLISTWMPGSQWFPDVQDSAHWAWSRYGLGIRLALPENLNTPTLSADTVLQDSGTFRDQV